MQVCLAAITSLASMARKVSNQKFPIRLIFILKHTMLTTFFYIGLSIQKTSIQATLLSVVIA